MALTLVAHDGFTGSAGATIAGRTPDTANGGGVWVEEIAGTSHKISSGGDKLVNTNTPRSYVNDSLAADQAVSVNVYNSGSLFLLARLTLGTTELYTYAAYTMEWAGTSIKIYECAGGGSSKSNWTQIGSATRTLVAGDEMRLEVVGTSVVGKINGSAVISTTDGARTSGQVALFTDFGGDGYVDNYKTYQDAGAAAGHPAIRRFGARPFGVSGVRIY